MPGPRARHGVGPRSERDLRQLHPGQGAARGDRRCGGQRHRREGRGDVPLLQPRRRHRPRPVQRHRGGEPHPHGQEHQGGGRRPVSRHHPDRQRGHRDPDQGGRHRPQPAFEADLPRPRLARCWRLYAHHHDAVQRRLPTEDTEIRLPDH